MLEESTTELVTMVNDTLVANVEHVDGMLTTLTALVFIVSVVSGAYLINKIIFHLLQKFLKRKE